MWTHEIEQKAVLYKPRCGMWSCTSCAAVNASKARFEAIFGARALAAQEYLIDFVTLTSHERLNAQQSIHVFPSAWHKVSQRMRRRADAEYFAVPEPHEDGRLHLHMMIAYANAAERLKKKFWKDAGRACGMGYQVDLQTLADAGGVGVYVSKYMHKSLVQTLWPKGFHRMRTSNNWPNPPALDADGLGWRVSKLPQYRDVATTVQQLEAQHYKIIICDERILSQVVGLGYGGVEGSQDGSKPTERTQHTSVGEGDFEK